MPQLGETVTEGTIANWHKQVGDQVEADEILLDVETDKVSMEIPSPGSGTLTQILVQAGETVPVGTVLAVVEVAGESAAAGASAPTNEPAAAAAAQASTAEQTAAVRQAGESTSTKAPARSEETGSAAAAASAAARPAGAAGNGAAVPAGAGGAAFGADRAASSTRAASGKPLGSDAGQRLSPAVRRLVAEHALVLERIEGTGRDGRITRRDVVRYLAHAPRAPQAQQLPPAARTASPLHVRGAETRGAAPTDGVVPFTRIRKLTAEHMVRSKATSAHVLQAVEVDFANVDVVRRQVREAWRGRRGYSLTYLPFIANAVCEALGEFPNLNSSVEGDALVLHEHVNLAIAVDLGPEGLVAPVIRSAERLSVADLAEAIQEVAARARQGRLKPDDLAGGTYTISNNGSFGTLITAPIINQPQVAILSTDGVRKKPVVVEAPEGDSIAIRPVGILAQSFDHRAVDGGYSGAFLNRVKRILEQRTWSVEI